MKNSRKVLLDKDILNRYVESFDLIREVYVPELKDILGQEVPIIKVRGASLNDHITAKNLSSRPMILLGTVLNEIINGREVNAGLIRNEVFSEDQLHPDARFEIDLFKRCVVEPKFAMEEVISISNVMPEFINRVVKLAIGITAAISEGTEDGNREAN